MLIFSRYTWWVATMVGIALLLTIAGQAGVLHPFQSAFLRATQPIDGVLTGIFRPVATLLSDAGDLRQLQDENARLRVENEELRNQATTAQQNADRVKELEEALKIAQATGGESKLAANIVHRDSSPFTDVVSIDRGSSTGVKPGMVVLSAQGSLVGTVTTVLSDHAFVRLITDSKSKVNAQLLESKADGIVRGSPGRGLTFDFAQAEIKVGDQVVTSGLGGNYPAGLPIGTVAEVSGTSQDLFRKVKVEPMIRLSTAQTVIVLTSFTPQRLGLENE